MVLSYILFTMILPQRGDDFIKPMCLPCSRECFNDSISVTARLMLLPYLNLQNMFHLLLNTGGRPKGLAKDKVESEIIAALSARPH